MLDKHEQFAREAQGPTGAQVICFQELFYGPYFGITEDAKYYEYAEPADGPIVQRFAALAEGAVDGHGAADLRGGAARRLLQHRGRGRRRRQRSSASTASTTSRNLDKFWEKFYFRPGNLGYPVFETAVGPIGVYICYDRHFPEGWRELGLNGAQIVFNPNATKPGLSNRLWEIEQPAAAAANGYFVAAPNRVGREDNEYGELAVDLLRLQPVLRPAGQLGRRDGQRRA